MCRLLFKLKTIALDGGLRFRRIDSSSRRRLLATAQCGVFLLQVEACIAKYMGVINICQFT